MSEALVIPHAHAATHEDGIHGSHGDSTIDEIMVYTSTQSRVAELETVGVGVVGRIARVRWGLGQYRRAPSGAQNRHPWVPQFVVE